jgi:LysM repeat protein
VILASAPADQRESLREHLQVIELTAAVRHLPVPERSPQRRQSARAEFFQQAAQFRSERETLQQTAYAPVVAAEPPAPAEPVVEAPLRPAHRTSPVAVRRAPEGPSVWQQIRRFFTEPGPRLVPVAIASGIVVLVFSSLNAAADNALPGDPTYALKEWKRTTEILFTPEEEKPVVVARQLAEQTNEIERAAERVQDPWVLSRATVRTIYQGTHGRLLVVGDSLYVLPKYQPDGRKDEYLDLTVSGDLQVGDTVELTYQIMPGNSSVVQGIALSVLPEQLPTPAPTATVTPNPTTPCVVTVPIGWAPNPAAAGASLAELAARSGVSAAAIAAANCLTSDTLAAAGMVIVPDAIYGDLPSVTTPEPLPTPVPPPATPTELPTALPTEIPVETPTEIPAEIPTEISTEISTEVPTATATELPTETSSGEDGGGAVPTDAPTGEATSTEVVPDATAEATVEATPEPTGEVIGETPTAIPTFTPAPSATPGEEATAEASLTPPETPTLEATPEATAEATIEPVITPEVTPTAEGAPTEVTPDVAATPTPDLGSGAAGSETDGTATEVATEAATDPPPAPAEATEAATAVPAVTEPATEPPAVIPAPPPVEVAPTATEAFSGDDVAAAESLAPIPLQPLSPLLPGS